MPKTYLDDNGNAIAPPKVYLDDNGNPVAAPNAGIQSAFAAARNKFGQVPIAQKTPGQTFRDSVMDQLSTQGERTVNAITHPIDTLITPGLKAGAGIVRDMATHPSANPLESIANSPTARDMLMGMIKPATVSARGAGALVAPSKVNAPSDEEWKQAAGDAAVNGVGLLAGEGIGKVAEMAPAAGKVVAKIPGTAADFLSDRFKPEPVVTMLRATADTDPRMPQILPKAMDELSAWTKQTGKPVTSAPVARQAIADRMTGYNDIVDKITGPQRDVTVPGSRAELADAKIHAIPDNVRLLEPRRYANLVKSIQDTAQGPDFTIGELDDLRKDLGAKNKSYGKNLSGQIAAQQSNQAIDMAAEKYVRGKFYDSLQDNSGTGIDVKELKSRIGAMINLDDALSKQANKSIIESGKSITQKAVETTGKLMTPGTTLKHFGDNATIDSDIASAMRRWQRTPSQLFMNSGGPAPLPPPMQQSLPPAPGASNPIRNVTPQPMNVKAKIIPRSGAVYDVPPTVKAIFDNFMGRQKRLSAGTTQIPEAPESIIDAMADEHMKQFADVRESGQTEAFGKLKRSDPRMGSLNAGEQIMQKMGRGTAKSRDAVSMKDGTPWEHFAETPYQISQAIRRGSGALYDRIRAAAVDHYRGYMELEAQKRLPSSSFADETKDWNLD